MFNPTHSYSQGGPSESRSHAPPPPPHGNPSQREPTLHDLMFIINELRTSIAGMSYSTNAQLNLARHESAALRYEVATLRDELAASRRDVQAVGSDIIQVRDDVRAERQLVRVEARNVRGTVEDVQRDVKGLQKKLAGIDVVVRKTAKTIDSVHSNTKEIEDGFHVTGKMLGMVYAATG